MPCPAWLAPEIVLSSNPTADSGLEKAFEVDHVALLPLMTADSLIMDTAGSPVQMSGCTTTTGECQTAEGEEPQRRWLGNKVLRLTYGLPDT